MFIKPSALTVDTWLVLANAIYFKGNWSVQFYPKQTTEQPFHLVAGKDMKSQIQLPKFKITSECSLKQESMTLSMIDAFDMKGA